MREKHLKQLTLVCRRILQFVTLGRVAALAVCIYLPIGCGTTSKPKQLSPPDTVVATAIVKDSIAIAQPVSSDGDLAIGLGFSCRSWAGVKFFLYEAQFGEVLTEWLGRSGMTLVQQDAGARYVLEAKYMRPDAGSGPDVVYRLQDQQSGEIAWQLTEPWPTTIRANVCRDAAMKHFSAVAHALASWDGTQGEVIDHSAGAVAAAEFRERVRRPSDPDSPFGKLQAVLEKRYASGEAPPVDLIDPRFQIFDCDGQVGTAKAISGYITIGTDNPLVLCENTAAGQRLLQRRLWECSPDPTIECVCGNRLNGSFSYSPDRPLPPDSIYSAVFDGPVWYQYAMDPDTLRITEIVHNARPSMSPCSFDE